MADSADWTNNYLALDAGNLWVHPAWADCLTRGGAITAAELLKATYHGEVLRSRDEISGWDNVRWIPERSPQNRSVFVKRHRGLPPRSFALEEAQAVSWCQQAQVPCMDIVAVGQIPGGLADATGRPVFSFFISDSIGQELNADRAIQQLLKGNHPDREVKEILESVARTISRFHSGNLFHGDCHLVHFLMDDQKGDLQARVIDLQGMRVADGLRAYYLWLKDMGQLRQSLIRLGLYRQFADDWYATYCSGLDSEKIQDWLRRSGRLKIALRGDWRMLRSIVSRFVRGDFSSVGLTLRNRIRAA